MKIQIKVFTKLGMNWKGGIEYTEKNIRNGEVLVFPHELEEMFKINIPNFVSVTLTYESIFRIEANFDLRQLSPNVWVETEPSDFTWNRFKRQLEDLLRKYLMENHLLKEDVS